MSSPRLSDELARNWPIDDAFLIELGRLSAVWSSLENLLNVCIGKLAGYDDVRDPTPFILLMHASFPQRIHALGALCEQLVVEAPTLSNYSAVIAKLEFASRLRNRFTHNGIAYDPDTKQHRLAVASARGKLKASVEPIVPTDIRAAVEEVHLAMLELYGLVLNVSHPPRWERGGA